jgi:glycosyltransferase involved in cell wall biosynthesis
MRLLPVIAAYNAEHTLPVVLDRFPFDQFEEVLVINDCSADGTRDLAQDYPIKMISHEVNRGVGAVIKHGLRYAIEADYDGVLIMAGNGKDDPRQLCRLVQGLEAGNDYVQGSRFYAGGESHKLPVFRRVMIRASAVLFRVLTGFKGTDALNGFRGYRISIFDDQTIDPWQQWLDKYEFESYLHYKVLKGDFKVAEVPVTKSYAHFSKEQKYSHIRPLIDWWRIVRPIVYLHFGLRK